MTQKLIELRGHQPVFNLLPIRYPEADEVLFVGTQIGIFIPKEVLHLIPI